MPRTKAKHRYNSDPQASLQVSRHNMKAAVFPRRRAVQACGLCRHRRTKCDNGRPSCSTCLTLEAECVYADKGDSLDPGSLAILRRLDEVEQTILEGKNIDKSLPTPGTLSPGLSLSNPPKLSALDPGVSDTAEYRYHVNVESMLRWPVFEGQDIDQHVSLKSLFEHLHEDNNSLRWSPLDPDLHSEEVDHALQRFLDHVHVFNPIFDEAELRGKLQRLRADGLGWNAESCLVLLTCAVGMVSEYTRVESSIESWMYQNAEQFFFAAQRRMGPLLTDSSVIAAQCYFLAGFYLATTMRPLEAWKLFVQCLACCQAHHSDSAPKAGCHVRSQSQQGIYWANFKAELEICLELDLAQDSINNLAYPTFLPSPPESLATELQVGWYFHLSDIAIRRLKNRSLNYIYHCERSKIPISDMAQEITNLEREAEGLCAMLPPELEPGSQYIGEHIDHSGSTLAKMRVEIQMHLIDCYEIMYWPFVVNIIWGEHSDTSVSLGFASKAIAICIERIQKSSGRYRQRQYATWLILRRSTRSALLLFGANLTPQLRQFLPPQWKSTAFMVIEMLRYWVDELKDVKNRLSTLESLMRSVESGDTPSAMEL